MAASLGEIMLTFWSSLDFALRGTFRPFGPVLEPIIGIECLSEFIKTLVAKEAVVSVTGAKLLLCSSIHLRVKLLVGFVPSELSTLSHEV